MSTISIINSRIFYLSSFFRSLYFTVPVWILFLQDRLTVSQISILVGYGSLVQLLLELPTGAFADIFGKRLTVILSYIFDALYFAFFAFAWSFPQFLLLTTLSGIGESLRSGSQEALMYDSLKQDRQESKFGSVGAHQSSLFQVGLIIASLAGGFLFEVDYRLPFILCAATQLVAGGLSFKYIEPTLDTIQFSLSNYLRQIKLGAREAFKSHSHRLISFYYIAVGSISWLVVTYYADFLLIDLGFSSQMRGLISGSLRLLNLLILTRFLTNERFFSKSTTLIFFPVLLVLSLTPGLWLNGWWGIPAVAGAMMSSTARWVLLAKYTNAVFDSRYRATAISTLSMAISLIYVIFTTLSGPIMENLGGSRAIFTLLGIISFFVVPPLAYQIIKHDRSV